VITSAAGVGPIPFLDDILDIGGEKKMHRGSGEKTE
jgi:hypothetical protein